MKKLVNPLSTGGAPIYGTETFSEILTQEVWDGIEATFGSLTPSIYHTDVTTDNMVLSGGEITDVGGGLFDVAAGIAYFKSAGGIIARFPALASVNPTVSTIYINLSAPVTEQKTFFDATPKDYAITHSAVVAITSATDSVTGFATTGGDTFFPTLQWVLGKIEEQMDNIHMRKLDIGVLDMSSVLFKQIIVTAVGDFIRKDKIISVQAWIRQDDQTVRNQFPIDFLDTGIGIPAGSVQVVEDDGDNDFQVLITWETTGFFNDTTFSSLADNRGYVLIHYDNS